MTPPTPTFAPALGRIPSGLFVLSLKRGDEITAMLASWVQQCGFDPPRISVAVKGDRPAASWLHDGCDLTVNVLADGEKKLVAHFGKGFEPGVEAFTGLELLPDAGPAPVLAAALVYLTCRPVSSLNAGDHTIFVCDVTGGAVLAEGKPAVHVRKSGTHY